jgi:coenzyme PQQ precursor peptide PqqA
MAHENHEASFMMIPFRAGLHAVSIGRGGAPRPPINRQTRICIMKWETPEAVDMRFGMEITMYVSNR